MMQANELWTALERFNMSLDLGRRIVRSRKADALSLLKELALTARLPVPPGKTSPAPHMHGNLVAEGSDTQCCLSVQDAQAALTEYLHSVVGDCVAVERGMARTYRRVTRLALLNEAHSVSNFLLAERGIARYPSYTVHRTRSAFLCLEQLEEYEAALEVRSTPASCIVRHL